MQEIYNYEIACRYCTDHDCAVCEIYELRKRYELKEVALEYSATENNCEKHSLSKYSMDSFSRMFKKLE